MNNLLTCIKPELMLVVHNENHILTLKKTEKQFILVNSVSFSHLYNTGICGWHSLKGQSILKQDSNPFFCSCVKVSRAGRQSNIGYINLKSQKLNSILFKSVFVYSDNPKYLLEYTVQKNNKKKMAPEATTDRLSRTTERNYVNMQLTSLYTLLYRHAKTTLL